MNPNVEKFKTKVKKFIATSAAKGSEIATNLLPECTESEVLQLEANYGASCKTLNSSRFAMDG